MHFLSYIFRALCQKNLTIDFIFAKNVLYKMCSFIQKRQMSFGKNLTISNDLIKDPSSTMKSQPLPKNVLYKPQIFYSKVSSHSKITPPTGATTTTRSPPAWGLATIKRRRRTQKSTRALVFVRSTYWSGLSWTILNKGCGA